LHEKGIKRLVRHAYAYYNLIWESFLRINHSIGALNPTMEYAKTALEYSNLSRIRNPMAQKIIKHPGTCTRRALIADFLSCSFVGSSS